MGLYIASHDDIDTRRIEDFLLCQAGVVDATVWIKGPNVLARVTVAETEGLDETQLRNACNDQLGPQLTPSLIMLQRALRPAA